MIRTHPEVFASAGHGQGEEGEALVAGTMSYDPGRELGGRSIPERDPRRWSKARARRWVSRHRSSASPLASVGGAPSVRRPDGTQGPLDLSLGIALGSCILISLFIAPVLVFASYSSVPRPLNFVFSVGGVGLMFLSVLIGSLVASGGSAIGARYSSSACT